MFRSFRQRPADVTTALVQKKPKPVSFSLSISGIRVFSHPEGTRAIQLSLSLGRVLGRHGYIGVLIGVRVLVLWPPPKIAWLLRSSCTLSPTHDYKTLTRTYRTRDDSTYGPTNRALRATRVAPGPFFPPSINCYTTTYLLPTIPTERGYHFSKKIA